MQVLNASILHKSTMVKGKVALVTGGGGGIGRATCETLAANGARVVVTDVDVNACEDTVANLTGDGHASLKLDVTKEEEVRHAFEYIISKYNTPPNIVINCAAILKYTGSVLEDDPTTMHTLFNINFMGTFLVTREACRALKEAKLEGSIVNLASIAAEGYVGSSMYGATKAAVIGFTKSVAKEMGRFGIRCNAVSPGGIDTAMIHLLPKNVLDPILASCSAQRLGKPQEVADLIAFLASDKSSYINASNVCINGGL